MKKIRVIKVAAICLTSILAIYSGLSVYGARAAMEIPRLPVNDSPASANLEYEDVSFTSRDDLIMLKGWYIPSDGDSVIVIVHGGFQNRLDDNVETLWLAYDLAERGYNLLLFDLRGRGDSAGKGLTLSNIDRDIGGSVDFLEARGYPSKHIYIIGFCSGAASACIFASQNDIGALVLDGCFANIRNMVVKQAIIRGIPEFLVNIFASGVLSMTRVLYDYILVNPEDVIADISCPILFIHEENDELISREEMLELFKDSSNPSNDFWEVSEADHSQSYKTHPFDYIEKVDAFFSDIEGAV